MDQSSYPAYEGKYEGYDQPPSYAQQQPAVQMSNVAGQPSAQVVTSQPGVATTNVIVNMAPPPGGLVVVNPGTKSWSTGMCECFADMKSCLCVTFCGICAGCSMASRLGENSCVPCCVPGGIISMRTKLRMLLGIQGKICDDCIMMQFCGPCTMCQMWREMDRAGIPE